MPCDPGFGQLDPTARELLEQSGEVGAAVIVSLESAGSARVMVAFSVPDTVVSPKSGRFDAPARLAWNAAVKDTGDRIVGGLIGTVAEVGHRYQSARAFSGTLSTEAVLKLVADPTVWRIDEDRVMQVALHEAIPFTRIDRVHQLGFRGQGVTVAILDTGIEATHPDLHEGLIEEECFCERFGSPCCPNGTSRQSGPGSAAEESTLVHGTYMAGIVAGRGYVGKSSPRPVW